MRKFLSYRSLYDMWKENVNWVIGEWEIGDKRMRKKEKYWNLYLGGARSILR